MSITWILGLIIVVLGGYILMAYNGLIRRRNRVQEAWSDIEVQLKRRLDLIPNLVEAVKGYATHEKQAFESVTEARARAMGATTPQQQAEANNMLASTLKSLFAVAEAYPDLKANANFIELQRELSDTENKIQAARRFYNTTVQEYNTALESAPTNVLATMFGFKKSEFFDAPDEEINAVPKVSF